jgi:V8-like Glu-specific endopeptidase
VARGGHLLCTGTLVGPAAVLTAKHCALLGASMPETRFVFAVGPDAFGPDAIYPISGWDWETGVEPWNFSSLSGSLTGSAPVFRDKP